MDAINDQQWPAHDRGLTGLRDWAEPLGWKLMTPLLAVATAVYWFHDELHLKTSLTLAVTPLTALLAVAIVPWIISLMRGLNAEGKDKTTDDESVQNPEDRAKLGLAVVALLNISLILVYVALPPSEPRTLIGTLSVAFFLYLLAIVISGRRTIPMLLAGPRPEPTDGVPLPGQRYAWVIDLLSLAALLVATGVVLAIASNLLSLELSTFYWLWWGSSMTIYFLYYVLSLSICGRTFGQKRMRIRIIRWGGDEIKWGRALLRALLGGASAISFILVSAMPDSTDLGASPLAFKVLYYGSAIGFGINFVLGCMSFAIVRDLHPKGQGVLDFCTDTVSIRDVERD